ncbi:MAG: DUF4280 domain-containing protein [Oscillospiraceae bacterium]
MGLCTCAGALMMCSFGMAPTSLMVLAQKRVMTGSPAATIMDNVPLVNIMPFSMCMSMANPTVAAATAAALGVLTPMPCVPLTTAPWAPGSPTILIGGVPALENMSKLMCSYGGVISIISPGQFQTIIGK